MVLCTFPVPQYKIRLVILRQRGTSNFFVNIIGFRKYSEVQQFFGNLTRNSRKRLRLNNTGEIAAPTPDTVQNHTQLEKTEDKPDHRKRKI
jgi:hypothetical protein